MEDIRMDIVKQLRDIYKHPDEKIRSRDGLEITIEDMLREVKGGVIETKERILEISNIARHNGLLALEEYICKYEEDILSDGGEINTLDSLLIAGLKLVVDGTDPEDVMEILKMRYYFKNLEQSIYVKILGYIIIGSVLKVQAGYNPLVIKLWIESAGDIGDKGVREKIYEHSW